jgi:acyl carrier protein
MKVNSQLLNRARNTSTIKEMICKKLGVKESEVTDQASLIKDLGADSVDFAELVMDLENKFGIAIPDDEVEKLTTTGSLIDYINRRTENSFISKNTS